MKIKDALNVAIGVVREERDKYAQYQHLIRRRSPHLKQVEVRKYKELDETHTILLALVCLDSIGDLEEQVKALKKAFIVNGNENNGKPTQ